MPPAPRIERAARIQRALLGAHNPDAVDHCVFQRGERQPEIIVDDGLAVGVPSGCDADGVRNADELLVVSNSQRIGDVVPAIMTAGHRVSSLGFVDLNDLTN